MLYAIWLEIVKTVFMEVGNCCQTEWCYFIFIIIVVVIVAVVVVIELDPINLEYECIGILSEVMF